MHLYPRWGNWLLFGVTALVCFVWQMLLFGKNKMIKEDTALKNARDLCVMPSVLYGITVVCLSVMIGIAERVPVYPVMVVGSVLFGGLRAYFWAKKGERSVTFLTTAPLSFLVAALITMCFGMVIYVASVLYQPPP